MTHDPIESLFAASREALARASDASCLATVRAMAETITAALKAGNKLLIAGNGGSAADAQHIAAEFVGRYKAERVALPAIALTTDTSALTAIGNDYGFEQVFARQVAALGNKGDVLLAISTSGRSPNIVAAIKIAKERGLTVIGMTGPNGGAMQGSCDILFAAPGSDTATVQQIHMVAAHAICDAAERAFSAK